MLTKNFRLRWVQEGGGALVSSIEDAQCVIIFEPSEKNAIKLHKTLAESERNIPVLKADWISASTRRGSMLGPKAKPEWGGFLLKYYRDAQEFFDDEPENIKEQEDLKHEPEAELIELTDSEDSDDGEEKPPGQSDAEPTTRKHGGPHGRSRKFPVPEDPRTAAQVLRAVAEDLIKYNIEDLVKMVKALKDKGPRDFRRTCEELAAVYRAAGKDYGVGANGWARLFDRNQQSYEICIDKLRRGDKSLDNLVRKESRLDNLHIPGASPAESASLPESSKSGGALGPAPTSPAAVQNPHARKGRPSSSHSFNPRSLMGVAGPSKPKKRAFTTIQDSPSGSEDDSERGGSAEPLSKFSKRLRR
ncbi:hypothetical protein FRC04_012073 [Tulasnella sp. 424]|nr:hypothetical protein FRC04_012073 [Tulasnella sp. 424]KAG8975829.1 hypothetical protein FRC05_005039 [Tulasnella sp. 425]